MTYARPIGYACLVAVIALIIVGLKTGRRALSSLGSIAFFLPTFGYFALSMFFLTGVGILRVLWLPFWDLSTSLLKLGDIIYLPYMILVYPFALVQLDIRVLLAYLAIGSGLLIFLLGTITWFYGKSERREIIDFWIYKYSRHPQYIGFLIWSYGVMLLAALSPSPCSIYAPSPQLHFFTSNSAQQSPIQQRAPTKRKTDHLRICSLHHNTHLAFTPVSSAELASRPRLAGMAIEPSPSPSSLIYQSIGP